MPDPNYGKITDERVAELRSRIGLDLDPDSYEPVSDEVRESWRPTANGFNVEVSIDTSRHFVRGYGDDNPLYCDPDYAAKTRWGTLIAPPTLFWTFDGRLEPRGELKPEIAKKLRGDPLRGVGSLQADVTYDNYRPMKRGDRIYRERAVTGIADKRSSWGGRAVHETTSIVTYNQDKEVVTGFRGTWIRAERRPVKEVKEPQPVPEAYTDEQLAEIDACYANELSTRRGAEPRYWEDVEVGEELPRMVKGPIQLVFGAMGQAQEVLRLGMVRPLLYQVAENGLSLLVHGTPMKQCSDLIEIVESRRRFPGHGRSSSDSGKREVNSAGATCRDKERSQPND